jgi:hypothetical protein
LEWNLSTIFPQKERELARGTVMPVRVRTWKVMIAGLNASTSISVRPPEKLKIVKIGAWSARLMNVMLA